jgi:xylulokinase
VLLAIDLGSTVTKAVLWSKDAPLGVGRATLRTSRRPGGVAEQDPVDWWRSVVAACAHAVSPSGAGGADGLRAATSIRGIVFSAARQTFTTVDADCRPNGPGIMWSDRRAGTEAAELAERFGGAEAAHRVTGAMLDAAAPAAKLAWLARHQPDRVRDTRWVLSPRDLIVQKMTGVVATDNTLAQSSGLYDTLLNPVAGLAGEFAHMLPPVLAPSAVAGTLRADVASELGLPEGLPVVVGAGDRACEVLGTAATITRPMVSWGTTANVSVPVADWPDDPGSHVAVSRGAAGGYLVEAGLSSAGSFLDWLAGIASLGGPAGVPQLLEEALSSPPGALGVTAVSWLGGARAPWWRDDARGALVGLSPEHSLGDLARAIVEAVAFEVRRCLEAISASVGAHPDSIAMAGGSQLAVWPDVLSAVTGLPVQGRRSGLASAAGAALVGSKGIGVELELDVMDPATPEVMADPGSIELYDELRAVADRAAEAVLGLGAGGAVS